MMLLPNWREIINKAWSVKLIILAALLSAVEVVLPFFSHEFPPKLFAALSGLAASAALVARIMAQKDPL